MVQMSWGTSVLHCLQKLNDKNFSRKGIQASVSDSRAVGYLLGVRSIIFLFLQLSDEVGWGAAQEMRSGHLGPAGLVLSHCPVSRCWLVTQQACACLPEGAWVCVDVGTLAITPAQLPCILMYTVQS